MSCWKRHRRILRICSGHLNHLLRGFALLRSKEPVDKSACCWVTLRGREAKPRALQNGESPIKGTGNGGGNEQMASPCLAWVNRCTFTAPVNVAGWTE